MSIKVPQAKRIAIQQLNPDCFCELLTGYDNEKVHAEADQILLQFIRSIGHGEVSDAYDRLKEEVTFYCG